MPEIIGPEGAGFPMVWWLWWFAAAFVVYGVLGIWFWRSARRHDETVAKGEGPTVGKSH